MPDPGLPVNPSTEPSRPALRVAAVQMNSHGSIAENLAKIASAAARAAKAGADAVLFPECALTGYTVDFGSLKPSEAREALRETGNLAATLRTPLLVGSRVHDGRRWYNGLAVFDRSGELAHVYAKCQLTDFDRRWFSAGESLSLFDLDGVPATAIVCHERRYPELVRIPVMAGAQVVFHPNAGLDALPVSKSKRGGRDGIVARAFENAVHYVFANTVGPQGGGKWSAGDSKIVTPAGRFLRLADHRRETVLIADLDLAEATRKYALDSLRHPPVLARHWRRILVEVRKGVEATDRRFRRWYEGPARIRNHRRK